MEIISEEISAWISTVSVKYSEKSTFRPVLAFFAGRFHDVKDNGDSILVVIPDYSLIGIGCITWYDAVLPYWAFGLLKVWKNYCVRIRIWGITKKQSINICHTLRCWCTRCIVIVYLQRLSETLGALAGRYSIRESVFYFIIGQGSKSILRNFPVLS